MLLKTFDLRQDCVKAHVVTWHIKLLRDVFDRVASSRDLHEVEFSTSIRER